MMEDSCNPRDLSWQLTGPISAVTKTTFLSHFVFDTNLKSFQRPELGLRSACVGQAEMVAARKESGPQVPDDEIRDV